MPLGLFIECARVLPLFTLIQLHYCLGFLGVCLFFN